MIPVLSIAGLVGAFEEIHLFDFGIDLYGYKDMNEKCQISAYV